MFGRSFLAFGRGRAGPPTLPSFVAAGAGATQVSSQNTMVVPMPDGIVAGDVLFLQMFSRTAAIIPTTLSGWFLQDNKTFADGRHQVVFYRVVDGTETSQTVLLSGLPNVAVGRTYAWRGALLDGSNQPTLTNESDGTAGGDTQFNMPTVTITGGSSTAIFLACFDESVAVNSPTGEAGGNWVETVAEYSTLSGNNATIFADHATLTSPSTLTVTGGTVGPGGGSDDGAYTVFALRGISASPTFVAAGTPVENGVVATITAALPAGIADNDILVAQFGSRTADVLPTAITGWEPIGIDTFSSFTHEHYLFARRVVDAGAAADLTVAVSGTLNVVVGRMYAFRDCAGVTAIESNQHALASGSVLTGPTLGPTSQPNELGVSFVAFDDDDALAAYSGATGGTWAEAVAEYTTTVGSDFGIQCQTVSLPSTGSTISGGTVTTTGDDGAHRSWTFRGAPS